MMIEKHSEYLKFKKKLLQHGIRHTVTNPTQNTAPCFQHGYPIILATFRSRAGSFMCPPLCCHDSLHAQNQLSTPFVVILTLERTGSHMVPSLVSLVDEDKPSCSHKPVFYGMSLGNSVPSVYHHPL